MRIVIVTEGGLVRDVYCDQEAEVEIIDLDEPSFATDEEMAEHEAIEDRHGEVVADESLIVIY